ncbi:MAG: hypothetical protein Q8N05_14755, partial [Bacteroidota bacterium]|nr:hypothetical protein [Bacteroidota bacterium]
DKIPPQLPTENDSRTLSWINPGKQWASYPETYGAGIDSHYDTASFRKLSSIPEPGLLARINNVPQAGQYTLSRGNDPLDASKKAFFHKVTSAWDQWDPQAFHTCRSEYFGGTPDLDMFLEGEEYWYITAFCFGADCFGHNGYNIDLSDIHEQNWTPETTGAVLTGGVMNGIGLGDNHGNDNFTWDYKWITGYPPVMGSPGSGELSIPLQTSPVVPEVWYYVIRKLRLHYDVTKDPYLKVWVAKGNGPLVLMGDKKGPNAYNLDNPRYYPKVGLYKWDQTWGSKTTRTLWTKGMYIFKAANPASNEPVIDQNSLLALLRSI